MTVNLYPTSVVVFRRGRRATARLNASRRLEELSRARAVALAGGLDADLHGLAHIAATTPRATAPTTDMGDTMTQTDLFDAGAGAGASTDALRDRILIDALTTEERRSERALRADEAGAVAHSLQGRHDTDTRRLRCTTDGRRALAKLAADRYPTTPGAAR